MIRPRVRPRRRSAIYGLAITLFGLTGSTVLTNAPLGVATP